MDKSNGYVKVYRSMLDWEWHDNPIIVATWMYCLMRANYTTQRWHGEIIQSGQFITSLENMAKDIGITVNQLRTAIKRLKSTNNITNKSTKKGTLITVEKWGLYQSAGEKVTNEITYNLTNKSQTDNKQITTDKKDKKEKKEKNKEIIEKGPEEGELVPNGQGAFAGARYREPIRYSIEETNQLLQSAHERFAPIKAALMKH